MILRTRDFVFAVAGGLSLVLVPEVQAAKIVVTDTYAIDSQEKIEAVRASDGIDIAEGATVTYSDAANPLFLNVPVSGKGTFAATGGKKIVLEADSRDFAGTWDVSDTFTAVSNRYGLGSSVTKEAKFTRSNSSTYLFMLWFGGEGLTNDVPLKLMTGGNWPLKENVTELRDKTKVAVFNGTITKQVALALSCYPAIYNGGTKSNGGSISVAPINNNPDDYATGMNGQWARFGKPIDDGAGNITISGGNNAVIDYYFEKAGNKFADYISFGRCRVHCEAKNVLKSGNYTGTNPTKYRVHMGGRYTGAIWKTCVVDMNGFDQLCSVLRCGWTPAEADGESYLTQVTSSTGPATLTMTYGGSMDTCTRFEGQASIDWKGTGTYGLANLVSTSTGELKVTSGAVELKWGGGWSGDAVVTNADARLVVSSARGFLNGTSKVLVSDGGRVEIAAGGVAKLGELTIGADGVFDMAAGATVTVAKMTVNGRAVTAGTYSAAGFAAEGLGSFVTGAGQVVVGTAAVTRGANPFDYMVFDMCLTNVTAKATAADIVDGVTYSAAAPVLPSVVVTYDPAKDATGYASFGEPSPLSIVRRENVPDWYYYMQNVTTSFNSLVFPKNVGTDGNDVTAAYSTPVLWKMLPKLSGSNLSVRIRFKWAGNYKQGGNWAWDQFLFQLVDLDRDKSICNGTLESIYPTQDKTSVCVRGGVGGSSSSGSSVNVHSYGASIDTWYDYVWVFENTSDSQCVIRTYFSTAGTGLISTSDARTGQVICPKTGNGAIVLGGQYGQFSEYGVTTGNTKWRKLMTESTSSVYSGFTGEISAFQIFDKALTTAEANAVLVGDGAGMTMRVGTLNGSADEFAGVEKEIVADFNGRTNGTRQLRKTLDAAHPSVSITCPFRPEESGLARYLTLGVLREDVMSAPVEVRCNGVLVDTLTFAEDNVKTLYVKGRYLRADADTNVVITLTRPGPVAGKLHLDALQLSGGWATGVLDGKEKDWCFTDLVNYASTAYIGNHRGVVGNYRDLALAPWGIWGLKNESPWTTYYYPENTLTFDLPAAALGENVTMTFELGIASMGSEAEFEVWCNDMTTPLRHVGPNESCRGKAFKIDIPPANRKAGLNVIKIRNVGTTFSGSQQYNYIYFDNFKLTVRERSTDGLLLIVR